MFVVFDLDGTLADISHRIHLVRDTKKPDWDAFFKACVDDLPNLHVIDAMRAHIAAGHRVEIWSARSDVVRTQTEIWLEENGIDAGHLLHMRAADDNTPEVKLKRHWLSLESDKPDVVYDDRQSVVDMWRSEGVPCFQVIADWESHYRKIAPVRETLLTLTVGSQGSGKTTWVRNQQGYMSSDDLRYEYCGHIMDQSRNSDVFTALHRMAKTRMECGLPVTIDATNLRRKDRLACVALAPAGTRVTYAVFDRPLEDKVRDGDWRNDVFVGDKTLVEVGHQRMQSVLPDVLAGDGLSHVDVLDMRQLETVPKPWRGRAA